MADGECSVSLDIAAYLGHAASRDLLGVKAPQPFGLASMKHGGDRHWRRAMQAIGHEPIAKTACSIAEMALAEYSKNPDSVAEVDSQAKLAVESLSSWRNAPIAPETRTAIDRNAIRFSLNVNVGGVLLDHARRPREGGDPAALKEALWIPAFAGMTGWGAGMTRRLIGLLSTW